MVYVCEQKGDDTTGAGTETSPFKTPLRALESVNGDENVKIQVRKVEAEGYQPISGAALKKAKKGWELNEKKKQKAAAAAAKDADEAASKAADEARRLEEAKNVVLTQDASLPKSKNIKIRSGAEHRGQRVAVSGWVHNLRVQGKDMMFVVLRDGSGFMQCLLKGKLCHTYDAVTLTRESTIKVYGLLEALPPGKTAPGGHELVVDYWEMIGKAPAGEDSFENQFNDESSPDLLLDLRHLVIRNQKVSSTLRMRHIVLKAFRDHLNSKHLTEITPPLMVQTQVEGGSTLFAFKYYDEEAYLTQSSQLYLETVLPSIGDAYCIAESFRAEKSHTRRHLSQFTHCEIELSFIDFSDLLDFIEGMVLGVVDRVFADPEGAAIMKEMNPKFQRPESPFLRMEYSDAINFPVEIKSFYMKRCADDERLTESVDVLMPNVGEIVGGSMRISDLQELLAGYKREGIDPTPYYWFTDQRKYGTCEHGGCGLGVERFLAWFLNAYTVRDVCLYPRFPGRCAP
ncbi:hypothetical protein BC829DRAFT_492526 [Chytridium lagenaria]|nr:hypothetical protein BC829DRAFT_492526 [Chytridium lagenaria]